MYRQILLLSVVVAARCHLCDADDRIDFNEHIRPLFTEHCSACHGGVKQAGDVSFARRDSVLPPNGWVVEPGDADASVLLERVVTEDEDIRMPPPEHGRGLNEEEVDRLRRWINQGARWSEHWAFEPPKRHIQPTLVRQDWCRQPVDGFVLARLEREGIAPALDEGSGRWLRRATMDATGLPPNLEQLESFETSLLEDEETAYKNAVERMLQSPAFGERWASVWLDQIRYADSKGLGLDGPRNVWKYRDWVIDAFNADMPFDQFTIKQMAGDLLPGGRVEDLLATAAHRVTQSNEEGGTDDEEFRVAAVLDRVNTTWQTWLGITFGCVQCHGHPYDPFDHDEYYQFASFFNNTRDCDLNEDWPTLSVPLDASDYELASQLDREINWLRDSIWKREFDLLSADDVWTSVDDLEAASSNATQVAVSKQGDRDTFETVGTIQRGVTIALDATVPDKIERIAAVRLTIAPQDEDKAISDAEWGFVISQLKVIKLDADGEPAGEIPVARVISDEPDPFYDPQASMDPKSKRGFAGFTKIHYPRSAALIFDDPVDASELHRLRVSLSHNVFILSSFSLVSRRGWLDVTDDPRLTDLVHGKAIAPMRDQLEYLKSERGKIKSTSVPVLEERPDHLKRPTHVFVRGLFLTKDKQVTSGTPAILPALDSNHADRLDLARWMVSTQNPLTARVMVNRVWARIFGVGLVATEEDFGSSGETPSHPRLLDDLAFRFQDDMGWSLKSLVREILLSRAYRQGSSQRSDLPSADPQNRLLARGPRHRLSAEMVRDQALAISGLLSTKMHGPPVRPPIPAGVWKPFYGGDKWETPKPGDPDRYRRSIYTYTKRSIPYPMFAAFDAPSREFCAPRRLRSNTPLQALMTLNDQTFQECAEAFGKRIEGFSGDLPEQLSEAFRVATSRVPNDEEVAELKRLHEKLVTAGNASPLTVVASVLLNLDEVLTK
ncbi:MAG: PSD1 and planctomycete cytochrome C domain-containing protein [Planctomycetota bacterium]